MANRFWLNKKFSDIHRKRLSEAHKGYAILAETKEKISIANKGKKKPKGFRIGHQVSLETRKKIREAQKGKPRWTKKQKEKMSKTRKGKFYHSEEWKQKLKEKMKGNKYPLGNKMSEDSKEKIRKFQINNPNRKFKDTSIELKIEEELKKRKIYYQKQIPLCNTVIVDFYLPEYRIIIFCDGCFYHNCLIHYPNWHQKQKEKDELQNKILFFNGFNIYRFWEHEINKSVKDCLDKIFSADYKNGKSVNSARN